MAREPRLKAALVKASSVLFNKVWALVGTERFFSLRLFCSGLSSVMPTTSRVEADISFINSRKDYFNSATSDIALEGVVVCPTEEGPIDLVQLSA